MIIPGFHPDKPDEEYRACYASVLSHSGAKVLLDQSPADYQWQRANPVIRDVFDFGTAAHGLVLNQPDTFEVIPVDDKRGKAWSEAAANAREKRLAPITRPEFATIRDMADALSGHKLAMQLLSLPGDAEVSAYAPDEETGVMRCCRYDYLADAVAVDYKTTADESPRAWAGRYGHARKYRYDRQAAWYSDIAADLGRPLSFYFIAQRKTAPYPVAVIEIDAPSLAVARAENAEALRIYRDCADSGVWPPSQQPGTFHVISTDHQTPEEVAL